jgi:hypothetical protein
MKFETRSKVRIPGVGEITHSQTFTFPDESNAFGRVLDYRNAMRKLFPGCEFDLIEAKQMTEKRK